MNDSRSSDACRFYLIGSSLTAVICAEALLKRGHTLCGVIAQDDTLAQWARDHAFPVMHWDETMRQALSTADYDVLLSIINGIVLDGALLKAPRVAAVNYHGSLLPELAGLNPAPWAICEGRNMHGITWHEMTARIDAGQIYIQRRFFISVDETTDSLNRKCHHNACEAFEEWLDGLGSGSLASLRQNLAGRSYRSGSDYIPYLGFLTWSLPASEIETLVRAAWHGNAENTFGCTKVWLGSGWYLLKRCAVATVEAETLPGTVVSIDGESITVATGVNGIRVLELRALNGDPIRMSSLELLPGYPCFIEAPSETAMLSQLWQQAMASERGLLPRLRRVAMLADAGLPFDNEKMVQNDPRGLPDLHTSEAEFDAPALAMLALCLLQSTPRHAFRIGVHCPCKHPQQEDEALFDRVLPLEVSLVPDESVERFVARIQSEWCALCDAGPLAREIYDRFPDIDPIAYRVVVNLTSHKARVSETADVLVTREGNRTLSWESPSGRVGAIELDVLRRRFAWVCRRTQDSHARLADFIAPSRDTGGGFESINEMFQDTAHRYPEHTALEWQDGSLNYRQLEEASRSVAGALLAQGIVSGSTVTVLMDGEKEAIFTILGTLRAGCAYLPLPPSTPRDRLRDILRASQTTAVLAARKHVGAIPDHRVPVYTVENLVDWPGPTPDLPHVAPDSLAYVIYTSGSSGQPKGVEVAHGALAQFIRHDVTRLNIVPDDRILQLCALSFDASVEEIFSALTTGAALVLRADGMLDSMRKFLDCCEQLQLTVIGFFPALIADAVEAVRDRGRCPPSIRLITTGGEAVPAAAVREWQAFFRDSGESPPRFLNVYGLTETVIVSTTFDMTTVELGGDIVPIGYPVAGAVVHILDPEGCPIGPDEPGEIWIGGDALARGYLGRPDLTRERFVNHRVNDSQHMRFFRTGDRGCYRSDGAIVFLGRLDRQVKICGYRIELGEIEANLAAHPAIREAIVLARRDDSGEQRLIAYLVVAAAPSRETLDAFLAERLPDYMRPSAFVFLGALPRSENGKVDFDSLPNPETARATEDDAWVPPFTITECVIADVWHELLGCERVGRYDDFFELGGRSLQVVRCLGRIETELGVRLPVAALFENPTLEALAMRVHAGSVREIAPSVAMLCESGDGVPLIIMHGAGGGIGHWVPGFVRMLRPQRPVYVLHVPENSNNGKEFRSLHELARWHMDHLLPFVDERGCGLLGFCWAAYLGLELAVQLMARRIPVAYFGAIDTHWVPSSVSGRAKIRHFVRTFPFWVSELACDRGQRRARIKGILRRISKRFSRTEKPFSAPEPDDDVRPPKIDPFIGLTSNYTPRPTPELTVHLYRVPKTSSRRHSLHVQPGFEADLGWGRCTQANVHVTLVPGEHMSILRLPHVMELVAHVRKALDGVP